MFGIRACILATVLWASLGMQNNATAALIRGDFSVSATSFSSGGGDLFGSFQFEYEMLLVPSSGVFRLNNLQTSTALFTYDGLSQDESEIFTDIFFEDGLVTRIIVGSGNTQPPGATIAEFCCGIDEFALSFFLTDNGLIFDRARYQLGGQLFNLSEIGSVNGSLSTVPLPASIWMFISALLGVRTFIRS